MSVETDHEEERKVMCVPESLEALVTNLSVRRGVDEHHDEQHEMTRDASRLSVVNILCSFLADLCNKNQHDEITNQHKLATNA